jgi:hypothetical protein
MDIKKIVLICCSVVLFFGVCIFAGMAFSSCISVPSPKNFSHEECYICLKCLQLNQKNPDKSGCVRLCDGCVEVMKDARTAKK